MSGPNRNRRGWKWPAFAIAALAVTVLVLNWNPFGALAPEPETTPARARSEIAVTSLRRTVEAEGEVVYAENRPVAAGQGTITDIVAVGTPVDAGTVLFGLDDSPTVALTGDVPAWRAMTDDDEGPDVAQLESNLVALGYDGGALTVDEVFTDYTATVVERWQADLGIDTTGVVAAGAVAFVPEGAVVTTVDAAVGDAVGAAASPLLTVSAGPRRITFAVAAADTDAIAEGTSVQARLPDRTTVTATVTSLTPQADGSLLAVATIDPEATGDLPAGISVPVDVQWTTDVALDVLTVRANALTRLDTGEYVLEVVGPAGSTEFVPVEIGARSGSTVEIVTDLAPGTVVITP
ncbi:MAG: peptidoglycan-binding protein [Actinomycetota bacterium]